MATALCKDVCLWVAHVGCGLTRSALLALEPGARVWLTVDDQPQLFERMRDGSDGRSTRGLKPVTGSGSAWAEAYKNSPTMVEIEFVERPSDRGAAVDRFGDEPLQNDFKDLVNG